jgi:hypothetical protein
LTHYTKGTPSQDSGSEDPPPAPTVCRRPVSGTVSLPLSGCFSPFPHGTGSLSVSKEYLAFEGGPPIFRQDFSCPALLDTSDLASHTGLSPMSPSFPTGSARNHSSAGPRSLAATDGVSVDFLSSGYLDVSVPRVRSFSPMYSDQKYLSQPKIINCPPFPATHQTGQGPARSARSCSRRNTKQLTISDCQVGFPIRTSRDQRVLSPPPGLSQSATSFIASCCQGIHQTPFSRLIRSGRRQALL